MYCSCFRGYLSYDVHVANVGYRGHCHREYYLYTVWIYTVVSILLNVNTTAVPRYIWYQYRGANVMAVRHDPVQTATCARTRTTLRAASSYEYSQYTRARKVCVFFTLNRVLPVHRRSAHPVSVLIPHPRQMFTSSVVTTHDTDSASWMQ